MRRSILHSLLILFNGLLLTTCLHGQDSVLTIVYAEEFPESSITESVKILRKSFSKKYDFLYNLTTDGDRSICYRYRSSSSAKDTDPMENSNEVYYIDRSKGESIQRMTFMREEIYVDRNGVNIEWNLLDESKDILGYECYKAIPMDTSNHMTIWYTAELRFISGPLFHIALPGTLLEINIESGGKILRARTIDWSVNNEWDFTMPQYESLVLATIFDSILLGKRRQIKILNYRTKNRNHKLDVKIKDR